MEYPPARDYSHERAPTYKKKKAPPFREEPSSFLFPKSGLTLGELEAATCTGLTGLLTLNFAGIAGEQAFFFEDGAGSRVNFKKGAGDSVTGSAGLAGGAAAAYVHEDIVFAGVVRENQGLFYKQTARRTGEVLFHRLTIYGDYAGAFAQVSAGLSSFPFTNAVDLLNSSHYLVTFPAGLTVTAFGA